MNKCKFCKRDVYTKLIINKKIPAYKVAGWEFANQEFLCCECAKRIYDKIKVNN